MFLLVPLHSNRNPIILQFDSLPPIQLHYHRILQTINYLRRYPLVEYINNNGATYIAS